jgi:hypothetical protein
MITLTEEQQLVCDQIIESLKNKESCCLIGHAGVGKTFTLKQVLTYFFRDEVLCTAPTHQACNVFRKSTGFPCCTLASLLAKRKEIDYDTGEILFEPGDFIDDSEKIIIIDESSMLGSMDKNTLSKNFPKCVFLFVGDAAQHLPIGEEDFSIFDHFPSYELVTNMRCGKGNNLFDNIERIYANPIVNLRDIIVGGNVHKVGLNDLTTDDLIITYYNKTRISHNKFILDKFFDGKVCTDVKFVSNANLRYNKKNGTYIATNGEYFYPERVMKNQYELNYSDKLSTKLVNGYIITVKGTDLNYLPDRTVLNSYLAYFKSIRDWKTYYRINDYFDDIDLGWSISSHKCQGATYNTVTVDINDINSVPQPKSRKAALYVAMSRASESVRLISHQ